MVRSSSSTVVILTLLMAVGCSWGSNPAEETELRQNLHTLRNTIQQYTLDKQAPPGSLDDLVVAGYLRELPRDITGSPASWQVEYCEELASPEQTTTGICDVHSGSSKISTEGTPYNTW